ncbi:carboxymuconolactone decarboxylase family protein [Saccharomonospora xinjiangensis]|uniref:carboxymuconolactone decarboxylase family protein n=1 Tax=Saccharomonospora xinjiangensis TaxID=75294 RepID=UPI001070539C|nr:carboxymuconolactone decarboxylase family protein [Saccharomonospora xinjiangensis]QBQ62011.1 Carboxymuconolactone decarboxylase family protein [Saccharomonospora xinjiangensis]
MFVDHTLETAPPASRRAMTGVSEKMGYLPAPVGRLAESPQLLDGFLKISALFEATSLEPVAREVVILTVATRNGCEVCVAMHTAKLAALGASPSLVAALREQRPLDDERLEVLRIFTLEVIATAGAVDDDMLRAFLAGGFTRRNALEVVLGIGAYTTSTLANRLTRAPLDGQLADFAWRES